MSKHFGDQIYSRRFEMKPVSKVLSAPEANTCENGFYKNANTCEVNIFMGASQVFSENDRFLKAKNIW